LPRPVCDFFVSLFPFNYVCKRRKINPYPSPPLTPNAARRSRIKDLLYFPLLPHRPKQNSVSILIPPSPFSSLLLGLAACNGIIERGDGGFLPPSPAVVGLKSSTCIFPSPLLRSPSLPFEYGRREERSLLLYSFPLYTWMGDRAFF